MRKEFGSCTKHAGEVQDQARCLLKLWSGDVHKAAEMKVIQSSELAELVDRLAGNTSVRVGFPNGSEIC